MSLPRQSTFIYSGGTTTDLGTLGGQSSNAGSINNLGEITGQADVFSTDTEIVSDPFIYSNGVMTDLGNLGVYDLGGYSYGGGFGNSINDLGQIVGYAIAGTDDQDIGFEAAFLYTNGQLYNMNQLYASLLSDGSAPGFISLDDATGINDSGQIVGNGEYFDGTNTYEEGFILNSNEFSVPDAGQSIALLLMGLVSLKAFSARRGSLSNR
jgi:probable HAF family extracellular repeat protein